ncbi:CoA transferase [Corynebacterium sp. H128]|uniref:CoA transferase n=1 Tax=unclassified Corynebacterium TaxID=2624378 RepID=UPI0030950D5C
MQPLANTTVINLAVNVPGPWAAARLAQLGARVLSIEPPNGDPLRHISPSWHAELSAHYDTITLDLKSSEGQQRLAELLESADVLITSHRPSALARMGLSPASTQHLCHVDIVGDVADPEHPGHDLTYQAEAGTLSPPHLPKILLGDLMGAEQAVSAALALLLDGHGGHIRIGLKQAATDAATPLRHGITAPGGILGGGLETYGLYQAKDGWVAVAALEPHFAERMAGRVADLGNQTVAEILAWAQENDVPISRVE